MADMILQVKDVNKSFGKIQALNELNLEIEEGAIVGLIGPNGAGKTTLFNVINGFEVPDKGRIIFGGKEIIGLPVYDIASLGIGRVFQGCRFFSEMNALQNIILARAKKAPTVLDICRILLSGHSYSLEEDKIEQQALRLLESVNLSEYAYTPCSTLSFGQIKLIEIARSLFSSPRLVLLDEIACGLTPRELEIVEGILTSLKGQHTFFLIEHNIKFVAKVCPIISVLHLGQEIFKGPSKEALVHPKVIEIYLGWGKKNA